MKQRLDKLIVARGLVETRSEAANWIQLGRVYVNGRVAVKAGEFVDEASDALRESGGTQACERCA